MSDLCFHSHGDWTGPHSRIASCPAEPGAWVKWFINEEGNVYDYDERTQAEDFPNDFHTAYDSQDEAEIAAAHLSDPDPAGGAPIEQMSYADAISYAIFAINTLEEPHASDDKDVERLFEYADQVKATLVDIRETVQGMSPTS